MRRVLVVSPHPDDAEFGCGATMAKLAREIPVTHVLISLSEKTDRFHNQTSCLAEFEAANRILGVKTHIGTLFEHRRMDRDRQDILDYLIELRETYRPDTVFMPCLDDTHQDHSVVAMETFRAFRQCDLLGYDIIWNNLAFNAQAFFEIPEGYLEKKITAIMEYHSQVGRHYFDPALIRATARVRGAQAGVQYAESFANIRRFL